MKYMMIKIEDVFIRNASQADVAVMAEVESACFPAAEAGTRDDFEKRFAAFPECFLVAVWNNKVVGHINGCVTGQPTLPDCLYHDTKLHEPGGDYQTVFGLAVLPDFQHRGIAQKLMLQFIQMAKGRGKKGVVLTCKDQLIGLYESFGYICQGASESTHGNASWNDMLLLF